MHPNLPAQDNIHLLNQRGINMAETLIFELRNFDVSIGFHSPETLSIDFRDVISLSTKVKAFKIINKHAYGGQFTFNVFVCGREIFAS